jgi:hypothetical protein
MLLVRSLTRHSTTTMPPPWPRSSRRTRFGWWTQDRYTVDRLSRKVAEWFKGARSSNHMDKRDPNSPRIVGMADKIASNGDEGDTCKIRMLTWNATHRRPLRRLRRPGLATNSILIRAVTEHLNRRVVQTGARILFPKVILLYSPVVSSVFSPILGVGCLP